MINIHDKAITEILPLIGTKAFGVLLVIVKHLGKNSKAFPSKKRIGILTGLGRDSVTEALKVLEREGIITKEQRRIKGKMSSNIYTVKSNLFGVYISAESAEPLIELPCTEKPCTDLPCTEKPCTENPSISINKGIEVLNSKEVLKSNIEEENQKKSEIELSEHELREKIGRKTYLIFNDYLRQNLNLSKPKINLLLDWFDYRKENGKPVNCKYSMLEIYEKFQKNSYVVLKEAFAKSVSAGYPDLYTDKINPKPNQSPEPTQREKGKIKYYDFRETMELRGVKDESKIKEMYSKYEASFSQKAN